MSSGDNMLQSGPQVDARTKEPLVVQQGHLSLEEISDIFPETKVGYLRMTTLELVEKPL